MVGVAFAANAIKQLSEVTRVLTRSCQDDPKNDLDERCVWSDMTISFFLSFSLSLLISLPSSPLCVYVCEGYQHSLVPSQVPSPPRPPRLLRLLLVPSQVPSQHRNVFGFGGEWGVGGRGFVCLSVSLYLPLSVLCVCDYLSFSLRVCLCLCV